MDFDIIGILEKYGWMTAVFMFVGYLIKRMIDKDPYKFISKVTSFFKDDDIENEEVLTARRKRHDNELKGYKTTGHTRKERYVRYKQLREDITVISFLHKWERLITIDSTFDIFRDDEFHTKEEIDKRIWNAKLWLTYKIKLFAFGLDKILDNFETHYVEFEEDKYYKYLSYENWEAIVLTAVEDYTKDCEKDKINPDFLKMITSNHESSVQDVLEGIKKTLKIKIYNDDPILIIEAIYSAFHNAFFEAFRHIDDILKMNGELSSILKNWEIPVRTEIDLLKDSIDNLEFSVEKVDSNSSFVIEEEN